MAAGSMGGMFDPLKKKLAPVQSGMRNLMGAGKTLTNPADIARARRNPFLSITDTEVEVPTETRYPDAILRGKLGSKAPIVSSQTIDGVATEMDQEFLSMLPGAFAGSKEPKAMSMQRTGTDKNFEMAFQMPKRKKRRSLYDIGGTA